MYAKSLTEISELNTVELGSVIGVDSVRETESTDDVAHYEVDHFLRCNRCKRLSFGPFGEVINRDDGVLRTTFGQRQPSIISIPHTANGQGLTIWVISVGGALGIRACLWHLSHFLA